MYIVHEINSNEEYECVQTVYGAFSKSPALTTTSKVFIDVKLVDASRLDVQPFKIDVDYSSRDENKKIEGDSPSCYE